MAFVFLMCWPILRCALDGAGSLCTSSESSQSKLTLVVVGREYVYDLECC